jgi:hypothetical protein
MTESARAVYSRALRILLKSYAAGEEEDGTLRPHILHLNSDALAALFRYEAEVEQNLGDLGRFAGIRDLAGKAVGQALRIAALLEVAARAGDDRPLFQEPIGAWAMENAVRLVRALSTHALTVLGGIGIDPRLELLGYVLSRAQDLVENPPAEEEGGASLRNLGQATRGRSETQKTEELRKLVDQLDGMGCLRLVPVRREGAGQPASPKIEIHPRLRKDIPGILRIRSNLAKSGNSEDSGDDFPLGEDETTETAAAGI